MDLVSMLMLVGVSLPDRHCLLVIFAFQSDSIHLLWNSIKRGLIILCRINIYYKYIARAGIPQQCLSMAKASLVLLGYEPINNELCTSRMAI
jgi:hypothetical protein